MASMTLPQTFEVVGASGHVLRYCLYGPADGPPAIFHGGTPSTRFRRPRANDVASHTRLHHLVLDRPGYGGSTRRPGRTVADAVKDTETLADAYGWSQFAVFGGSGGGPHALACAALLPDRVTRCAVVSGIKPADSAQPLREEAELRTRLSEIAAEILAKIDAGGPEMPGEPGPPARSDPDAMARIRATFIDSMDGWVDDSIAFEPPMGLRPPEHHRPGRHLARNHGSQRLLRPCRMAARCHPCGAKSRVPRRTRAQPSSIRADLPVARLLGPHAAEIARLRMPQLLPSLFLHTRKPPGGAPKGSLLEHSVRGGESRQLRTFRFGYSGLTVVTTVRSAFGHRASGGRWS